MYVNINFFFIYLLWYCTNLLVSPNSIQICGRLIPLMSLSFLALGSANRQTTVRNLVGEELPRGQCKDS